MARKASPETQYKRLEEAMSKLEPEQQLRWIYKFLEELDPKSLVMGGVLDCLQFYIDDVFTDTGMFVVDDGTMTGTDLIQLAQGADDQVTTAEEAVTSLRRAGFHVQNLGELDASQLPVHREDIREGNHAQRA